MIEDRHIELIHAELDGELSSEQRAELSRVLLAGFFKGDRGEQLLMPTSGGVSPVKLFAVGSPSVRRSACKAGTKARNSSTTAVSEYR